MQLCLQAKHINNLLLSYINKDTPVHLWIDPIVWTLDFFIYLFNRGLFQDLISDFAYSQN